jgi:hypothetical protein
MKAEIKKLHSPDIYDLKNYQPAERNSFGFLLQIIVGEKGGKGEESFDVVVCTPQWLMSNFSKDDIVFGRHYLIVFEYNFERILSALQKQVESIEADTWKEIGEKIGRIGKWEFEDYGA